MGMKHHKLPQAIQQYFPAIPPLSEQSGQRRRNGLFWLFCLILFGGIVYGAVSGRSADKSLLQQLDVLFQTNFEVRCQQGAFSAFVSSAASSVLFLTVMFLLGLSLWGGFFAVLIPFGKGYGYGLSVGFLYGAYGWQGIGYNLLIVLPGMFLSSIVMAAAALAAFQNSLQLLLWAFHSPPTTDSRIHLQHYGRRMAGLLAGCFVAALADMLFSLCFSWLFHF